MIDRHLTPNALDLARARSIADVGGLRRVAEIWRGKGHNDFARFYDESAEIADALAELARRYLAPVAAVALTGCSSTPGGTPWPDAVLGSVAIIVIGFLLWRVMRGLFGHEP